jgi:hypothetical protein
MSSIKMDRRLTERLTLLLANMVSHGYDSPYSMLRDAYESNSKLRNKASELFPELTRSGFSSLRDLTWEDMLEECTDLLQSGGGAEGVDHFPALIAKIVELLQAPHGREVLAGDTLKRLRKAVLFPEEMATIAANAAKELHCSGCGHPFAEIELATHSEGNFFCTRCLTPTSTACIKPACDGAGELDHRGLQKMINKSLCNQHNGKPAVEPIPAEIRAGLGAAIGGAPGGLGQHPFGEPAPPNMPQWIEAGQQAQGQPMAIPRDPRRRAGR